MPWRWQYQFDLSHLSQIRDAVATANAQSGLNEQSGNRFLLGLGVSHKPLVSDMRGHSYGRPVPTMRAYLEAMRAAPYQAPPPSEPPRTVLAALGPKMLALAAEMTDGAHPYCVTPEHTAEARRILGPGKLLCPELMVVLEADSAKARAAGRAGSHNSGSVEGHVASPPGSHHRGGSARWGSL